MHSITRHIKKNFALFLLVLFSLLTFFSCVDLSNDPVQNKWDSKINIISPTNNGTLEDGNNIISYSLQQPYSIKFIELYVNDKFVKNIPPNSNGTAPEINLYVDSTEIGKTFSLYLIYYDTDGTSSKSNIITNLKIVPDQHLPYKPYKIELINFGNGTCNISWKDSSRYIEKYELWRKVDVSGSYYLHLELSGNDFNTNDFNLDSNKIYFYKIRGVKNSGVSEFSDEINTEGIITSGNIYPPTNVLASLSGSSVIKLTWDDKSNNENYFSIERSTINGTFSKIADLPPNTTSFSDSNNLTEGVTYYYRIKVFSNSDSAISKTVQIRFYHSVLIAPTIISGEYNSQLSVIELKWTNIDNNILFIDIERKTDSSDYAIIRRVNASVSLFLDFSVFANQIYTYRVRGYDLNNYSAYSNEISISTF